MVVLAGLVAVTADVAPAGDHNGHRRHIQAHQCAMAAPLRFVIARADTAPVDYVSDPRSGHPHVLIGRRVVGGIVIDDHRTPSSPTTI